MKCDLCNKESVGGDWAITPYLSEIVVIEWAAAMRKEDGTIEHGSIYYTICPECFHTKLIKWFRDQNVKEKIKG